jgi:hypothetical protein
MKIKSFFRFQSAIFQRMPTEYEYKSERYKREKNEAGRNVDDITASVHVQKL